MSLMYVRFPLLGFHRPVAVEAKTRYEAAIRAAAKHGLLKPGVPRIFVAAAAKYGRNRNARYNKAD